MSRKRMFILALLLLLAIFIAQNYGMVKIRFLFWSFQTSRAIIIFSTLIMGILIGVLGSFLARKD